MASRQLAIAAALLGIAIPGHAFDTRDEAQSVMFYYAIPLDAKAKKERTPWLGMQLNGKRDYQAYSMDAPLFRLEEGGATAANLLVVGGVALGAVVLVASRGKSAQQQVQQQQEAQAARQPSSPAPCPQTCP